MIDYIFICIIRKVYDVGDIVEKISRNGRIAAITKYLIENPNKVIGLNTFSELLNAAKSTISEDIVIVRIIRKDGYGED